MFWQKISIAAVTGAGNAEGNDWDVDSLRMPDMRFGVGASRFPGVTHRAIGLPVTLAGQQIIDVLAKHDTVILQHWPPRAFVELLVKSGVKQVLLWTDYECIPERGYWSNIQAPIYLLLKEYRALSATKNRFDESFIDPYEAAPAGTPEKNMHCHYVDMWSAKAKGLPAAMAKVVAETLMKYYAGLPVGLFFDNCMPWPYFGTATNAPILQNVDAVAYARSWQEILSWCRKIGLGPLWGNCAAATDFYPQLDGKLDELVFVPNALTPTSAALASMESIDDGEKARRGLRQGYAWHVDTFGAAPRWAHDEKLWQALHKAVPDEAYGDNLGVVTLRTGKWIFHPGDGICS